MCAFCEQDAKVIGKFLGYPKCCTDWFVNHQEKHGKGDVDNLTDNQLVFIDEVGFMPCPSHAEKLIKEDLPTSDIISGRICSEPFPYTDENSLQEFNEYLTTINTKTTEE
jgi:hypothetical protein